MERTAALSTGTKLILACGGLLFLDLFFTWQKNDQMFGKKFVLTQSLDGWDAWGLLLGLLTLAIVTLAIIRYTGLELSPEVPWNLVTLVLGALVFLVAFVKNLTDSGSTIPSYVGVALAGAVAVGAYLDRSRSEPQRDISARAEWKPRVRPAAQAPSADGTAARSAPAEPEPRSSQPAKRW
jgi:MFS superfamily sulfate permease-like transporter